MRSTEHLTCQRLDTGCHAPGHVACHHAMQRTPPISQARLESSTLSCLTRSGHPRSTDHEYSTTRPQTDPVMSDAITPGGHLLVVGHTVCNSTRQPKLKLIGTKPDAEHTANITCLWFLDVPSVTSITNI